MTARCDAFISYSRKDSDVVRALHGALKANDRESWVDWQGIPATAEWRREICSAIEGSDTFIFVISPESVASDICKDEVAHAVKNNKRLVPILRREVNDNAVPHPLGALHWILLREGDDFDHAFRLLLAALDTDLDWVRSHTRLLTRAIEWDSKGRETSLVLSGRELADAERWLALGPGKEPKPTALQTEYILGGRAAATKRQRLLFGTVTCGLIIAVVLAAVAYGQFLASETRRKIAVSRQLAGASLALVREGGMLDRALLLSVEANQVASSFESRQALLEALELKPHITAFLHSLGVGNDVVAFSPDGHFLATASKDHSVALWDIKRTSHPPTFLVGHKERVTAIAFSSNSRTLVSGSADSSIILWNLDSRQPQALPQLAHKKMIWRIGFASDGKTLLTGSLDGTVVLWDVSSRRAVKPFMIQNGEITSLAFAPNGGSFVSGGIDGFISVWDVASGKRVNRVRGPAGRSELAYSPHGKYLVSGHVSGQLVLWDDERQQSATIKSGHVAVARIAFHPNGRVFATSDVTNDISLWSPREKDGGVMPTKLAELTYPGGGGAIAFASGKTVLASKNSQVSFGLLWDLAERFPIHRELLGHKGDVNSVAFSRDGKLIASGSSDKTIIIWEAESGKPTGTPLTGHDGSVTSVAFSQDGKILASGGEDKQIWLWDVETGRSLRSPLLGHDQSVTSVAFSPNGNLLASSSEDDRIILWNTKSYEPLRSPLVLEKKSSTHGSPKGVNSIAFSMDGRLLASGSNDNTITLWSVDTGDAIGSPLDHPIQGLFGMLRSGVASVAFSPDGKTLASGSFGFTVKLWDLATRRPLGDELSSRDARFATTLSFSRDGKLLAAPGSAIQLWDISDQHVLGLHRLGKSADGTSAVSISPDGKRVASDGPNGSVRIWNIDVKSWIARACRIANRNLTTAEWEQYVGDEPYRKTCPDPPAEDDFAFRVKRQ
jgi:WD40 repeat protein